QIICRDACCPNAFRRRGAIDGRKINIVCPNESKIDKTVLPGAPVEIIQITDRPRLKSTGFSQSFAQQDQFLRMWIRKRSQQNRVHDTEDRGVRANAESERGYRDNGKARIFPELPQCETNVV